MSEHLEHAAAPHSSDAHHLDVGYDHAEPSGRPLFLLTGIAAVVVVVLIGAVTMFFNHVQDDAIQDKVLAPPSDLLVGLHQREDKQLYSYQVIDPAKGTVQLPIDRAMELVIKEAGEGKLPFPLKSTVVGAEVAPAAPAAAAPAAPGSVTPNAAPQK
jgi:hypothetical protein